VNKSPPLAHTARQTNRVMS